MTKLGFVHALGAIVLLAASKESGTVIGRAEFSNSEDSYLIRYKAGDGRQTENWWGASAIVAKPQRKKPAQAKASASRLPTITPVKLSFDTPKPARAKK